MPFMKPAWVRHIKLRRPRKETIDFPVDLADLVSRDEQPSFNVVLIHDVTAGRDVAWSRQSDENDVWYELLAKEVPKARILTFGYDASSMTELSHMLDPGLIEHHAEALLESLKKKLGEYNESTSTGEHDVENMGKESLLPLVVVAHGYGGLVYERALLIQKPPGGNFFANRFQLALLLGTPHYDAGLGEWAIMCAKRRNIRCANNSQSQRWTENLKESIAVTRGTQTQLRTILKEQDKSRPMIQIAGCFATLPVPGSKLMMSPEWAVMPEFTPISMSNNYFGLTNLHRAERDTNQIKSVLSSWIENIQNPTITEHIGIGEHNPITGSSNLTQLDVPDRIEEECDRGEQLMQRADKLNQQYRGFQEAPSSATLKNVPLPDGESTWLKSIKRFKRERPKEYELMMGKLHDIQNLEDVDTWEDFVKGQDLDNTTRETKHTWLRKCKAQIPSPVMVRGLAQYPSNVELHEVAPHVIIGIFVLVEFCFGLMDPSTRDNAMELLLKTNMLMSKWVFHEGDLARMKVKRQSSKHTVNWRLDRIEEVLSTLYFSSLVLTSKIYKYGQYRSSRSSAIFVSGPPEWKRAYQDIENKDWVCEELKKQIETIPKHNTANTRVLDWIQNREQDPEPLHQGVRKRTGFDNSGSTGGKWFLETSEFSSWVDGVRQNTTGKRVFWLKGPMGTGKTTLLCHTISHFEDSPVDGVKFVPYYCHGSGTGPGPTCETIIRALCRRLACNDDGSVAKHAMRLYKSSKSVPDVRLTVEETWAPLLRDLVASSATTIVLVLDALDECKSNGDFELLLKCLKDLPRESNGPYLLVSSRPQIPVRKYFDGSAQTFDIVQPETRNEMKRFVENQITSKRKEAHWEKSMFFKETGLVEELKSALLDSAGGMFRWVEIWLGMLFSRNTNDVELEANAKKLLKKLKSIESLENFPHDETDSSSYDKKEIAIKQAYKKLWDINGGYGQDIDLQIRLFQIITASFQSLTPWALFEAVCFSLYDPGDYLAPTFEQIERLYSGFLRVNEEGCLEYEHVSAKKFVEEIRLSDRNPFSSEESHRTMADIGIRAIERPSDPIWSNAKIDLVGLRAIPRASNQLTASTVSEQQVKDSSGQVTIDSVHFGPYLFRSWLRHCQLLRGEDQLVRRMSDLFRRAHPALQGWIIYHAQNYGSPYRDTLTRLADQDRELGNPSPLLCMVCFEFWPVSDSTYHSEFLSGFQDFPVRNLDQKTALHIACQAPNVLIVEDLLRLEYLRKGSCIGPLIMEDGDGRIPLHLARTDDVVKILLQHEMLNSSAQPTTSGSRESRLLHWRDKSGKMAIEHITSLVGSEDLVNWILLVSRVEPQVLEYLCRNALRERKLGTLKLLLENGADPNVKMDGRTSALSFAMDHSNAQLATLLLDHGASLDDCEELGSILAKSAQDGNLDMLELLYRIGVSFNTIGPKGETALCVAIPENRIHVIEYLLSRGADACAPQGPLRYTLLQRAAATGNTKIAGLLLANGADVNAAGKPEEHETSLGKSVSAGSFSRTTSVFFQPPLAVAVSFLRIEMAEFLIRRGADVGLLDTRTKETLYVLLKLRRAQGEKI